MKAFWDDRVAEWVARHIPGHEGGFGHCTAMGVLARDRKLAGGVVFHNWHPEAGVVELSAAAADARAFPRSVMREAFSYAFGQLGCQMAVARCDTGNMRVRRFWKALGAKEYVIPRLRGRHAAEVILTLTDDAWQASRFNEAR